MSVTDPDSFRLIYAADAVSTVAFAVLVAVGLRRTPGFGPARSVRRGRRRAGLRRRAGRPPFAAYLVLGLAMGVFGYAQLNGPWAAFVTGHGGAGTRVVGLGFAANTAVIVGPAAAGRAAYPASPAQPPAAGDLPDLGAGVDDQRSRGAARPARPGRRRRLHRLARGLRARRDVPQPGRRRRPNALAPDVLRGRYNALAGSTIPVGALIGPPLAGLALAGPQPALWVVLITAGALAVRRRRPGVGRLLPAQRGPSSA